MRHSYLVILIVFSLIGANAVYAQSGAGRFCVRAFEDINGNQQRDAGEILIQSGIVANLQNANGVVIDTAAIENSSNRANGLICFENLPDGQYGILVVSAVYQATTIDSMVASVRPGDVPQVMAYGGQRIDVDIDMSTLAAPTDERSTEFERLLVATLGGFGTMLVVAFIGLILFFVVVRRPAPQPTPATAAEANARFRPPGQSFRDPSTPSRPSGAVSNEPPPASSQAGDEYDEYQDFL